MGVRTSVYMQRAAATLTCAQKWHNTCKSRGELEVESGFGYLDGSLSDDLNPTYTAQNCTISTTRVVGFSKPLKACGMYFYASSSSLML